jgi:hypothetical protein
VAAGHPSEALPVVEEAVTLLDEPLKDAPSAMPCSGRRWCSSGLISMVPAAKRPMAPCLGQSRCAEVVPRLAEAAEHTEALRTAVASVLESAEQTRRCLVDE